MCPSSLGYYLEPICNEAHGSLRKAYCYVVNFYICTVSDPIHEDASSCFLGTLSECPAGVVFICEMTDTARVGCFCSQLHHTSSMLLPTDTLLGIGYSAITPMRGAVYAPPVKPRCCSKYC